MNKHNLIGDLNTEPGNCATFLLKIEGVLDGLFQDMVTTKHPEAKVSLPSYALTDRQRAKVSPMSHREHTSFRDSSHPPRVAKPPYRRLCFTDAGTHYLMPLTYKTMPSTAEARMLGACLLSRRRRVRFAACRIT